MKEKECTQRFDRCVNNKWQKKVVNKLHEKWTKWAKWQQQSHIQSLTTTIQSAVKNSTHLNDISREVILFRIAELHVLSVEMFLVEKCIWSI